MSRDADDGNAERGAARARKPESTKARRRKAPANTEWRGDTLHGRVRIKGKLHRWSLRTGDVEIAVARRDEEIARLKAIAFGDNVGVSYEDAFAGWADHIVDQVGPLTAKRYASSLKQLEPWLKEKFIVHADAARVIGKATVDAIVTARKAQGVAIATVRRDLTALSSVLIYAEAADNPALERLERLKEKRDPIVLPLLPHIERVVARCPGRLADLAIAARLTGCRQDELVAAERGKLDHTHRQLTVRGKGNKSRTIDLSPAAYAHLRGLPAHLKSKLLFWHGDGEPYRNVASRFSFLVRDVFVAAWEAAHGLALPREPTAFRAALADLLRAQDSRDWHDIGFRTFTFHELRHYFAVDYLKTRTGTIYDLQQHLGHESVKTTEIYLRFLTAEEKRVAMYGTGGPPPAPAEQKGA